ncbi:catechol 2,3-dioxygenase-like lactoylglutathione lyase family enzyme [Litorimonas taeanensis]|uniref:Catechol 2,3-dioxygenase-like lactoylglutathione lyase family enzyme n=2 Tax=Litorimonas taeanensis TaxID=568099 RepID=A0A420WLI5_9PROT|nr:catechol 2,3-dioxygenase-like lactoylglutathione lyase family enzyme [Litorimonas taeanensis]
MQMATLEHLNISVQNPKATAEMLGRIFGWEIRWQGPSLNKGYTVHVGAADSYLALYSVGKLENSDIKRFQKKGGLNHIGIVVDDMESVEARVIAEGFVPRSHADYEPGRRFYFFDKDAVEYEVVSYIAASPSMTPSMTPSKAWAGREDDAKGFKRVFGRMCETLSLLK